MTRKELKKKKYKKSQENVKKFNLLVVKLQKSKKYIFLKISREKFTDFWNYLWTKKLGQDSSEYIIA